MHPTLTVPGNIGTTIGVVAGSSVLLGWTLVVGLGLWPWRRFQQSQEHTTVYRVKESTLAVMEVAQHVSISKSAISRFTSNLQDSDLERIIAPAAYDASIHFVDGTWKTVQYLLVLDALNFCFWPGMRSIVFRPCNCSPSQLVVHVHDVRTIACLPVFMGVQQRVLQ